jgi:hypothetical protein
MADSVEQRFVNIIASIDLRGGGGQILYVNPSAGHEVPLGEEAMGASPRSPQEARYEIVAQDKGGTELARQPAQLQVSSCAPGEQPPSAMVAQDIPLLQGMSRLLLQRDGQTIAEYEAGQSLKAQGAAAPGTRALGVGPPVPGAPHRRPLELDDGIEPESGVSYTVQVRPDGSGPWQTIALGQAQPKANIDARQFPGARKAQVRVLRTTGFEDEVIAEKEVEFGSE